ncbi:MAG: choice-of-anchor D domain-containing protein [Myxococcaceae bacterium]|nr:choice-of-anchor D domain-containing protein [Myxococcaceae bacterium]
MLELHRLPVVVVLCLSFACARKDPIDRLRPLLRADPTGLTFEACPNPGTDGADPFAPGPGAELFPDQRTLTVFNDGLVPGDVRATLGGDAPDLFRVVSAPDALEPGARAPLVLRFSPRTPGPVSATLTLDDSHDGTPPVTVPLIGAGSDLPDAPVLALAVEDAPGVSRYSECEDLACLLAFPDTDEGHSSTLRVALRNHGCRPLRIVGAQLRPAAGGTALPFFLDVPATAPTAAEPLVVATGDQNQLLLTLRFAPPRSANGNGSAWAELVLETNDPDTPFFEVDIFGQWLAPALTITPDACDLSAQGNVCGAVLAGGAATGSFTVRNDGSSPVTLTGASFRGGGAGGRFQLGTSVVSQSLSSGAILPLQVGYQDATLYVSDVLVLEAESGGLPAGSAELRVSGGLPPALSTEPADRLVFTPAQGPMSRTVTVRNGSGGGPLVIRGITLDVTSASTFRLVGVDGVVGATLGPGESRAFNVEYTPPVTGGRVSGALRIEANVPVGVLTLPVEG